MLSLELEDSVKNAISIFFATFLSIYFVKPALLFDEHSKKRREFGIGFNRDKEKKTLFDLTIVMIVLSVLSVILSKLM